MKNSISIVSDLHGYLPDVNVISPTDVLLIAGDVCPGGRLYHNDEWWVKNRFIKWIDSLKSQNIFKEIIFVPGNHDGVFQNETFDIDLKILIDQHYIYNNIKIYGSPWQIEFYNWAFNLKEDDLSIKWEMIPKDTDILLTHSPPYGILDSTVNGKKIGSPSLAKRIIDLNIPLCCFGHNHNGFGKRTIDGITYLNGSYVDEYYIGVNRIQRINVEKIKGKRLTIKNGNII